MKSLRFTFRTAAVAGSMAVAASAVFLWQHDWSGPQSVDRAGDERPVATSAAVPAAPVSARPKAETTLPPPFAAADLTAVFPPSEMPMVATAEGARAALGYLRENGADLSRPMPSRHRVFAANAQVAAQVAEWARTNGFEVRGPEIYREHTGTPRQRLELVRIEVPDPDQIEREGRLVLAAVQQIPGTYYQTWSGEIVR